MNKSDALSKVQLLYPQYMLVWIYVTAGCGLECSASSPEEIQILTRAANKFWEMIE